MHGQRIVLVLQFTLLQLIRHMRTPVIKWALCLHITIHTGRCTRLHGPVLRNTCAIPERLLMQTSIIIMGNRTCDIMRSSRSLCSHSSKSTNALRIA